MRYLLMIFSIVSFSIISNAQVSLTFQYLDIQSENYEGFPNEKVQLKDNKTGKIYTSTTDQEGNAAFDLPFGTTFSIILTKEQPKSQVSTEGMRQGTIGTYAIYGYGTPYFVAIEEAEKQRQEEARQQQLVWEAEQAAWKEQQAKEQAEREAAEAVRAKRQADWEAAIAKEVEESGETAGSVYFYLINEDGGYVGGLKTYDGENDEGGFIGESSYFWRGATCTNSVVHSEQPIKITRAPGTYDFYAFTGSGKKEWVGTYTVEAGKTKTLGLNVKD